VTSLSDKDWENRMNADHLLQAEKLKKDPEAYRKAKNKLVEMRGEKEKAIKTIDKILGQDNNKIKSAEDYQNRKLL
jgi:DNA-directed RNA polymerase subunit F